MNFQTELFQYFVILLFAFGFDFKIRNYLSYSTECLFAMNKIKYEMEGYYFMNDEI